MRGDGLVLGDTRRGRGAGEHYLLLLLCEVVLDGDGGLRLDVVLHQLGKALPHEVQPRELWGGRRRDDRLG